MAVNCPILINSPVSLICAPYARLCQSTHLLGKVMLHHQSEESNSTFWFEEAFQLGRTLHALSATLQSGDQGSRWSAHAAVSITYTALLLLHRPHSCTDYFPPGSSHEQLAFQSTAITELLATSDEVLQFSETLTERISTQEGLDQVSPLVCNSLYIAATVCAWRLREAGNPEFSRMLDKFRDCLSSIARRWRSAGESPPVPPPLYKTLCWYYI